MGTRSPFGSLLINIDSKKGHFHFFRIYSKIYSEKENLKKIKNINCYKLKMFKKGNP